MSLSNKTKKWLNKNCGISLKGKTVIVTGANSGIGFKTAEISVYLGADVILACRDENKASSARDDLLRDYPDANVKIMKLDLASLSSIDAFVKELVDNKTDVYAFVNNAGCFHHPGKKTEYGCDLVIGTNYFGVYYLSERILPYLETLHHDVIYVNTVSVIIKTAKEIDYQDFYFSKKQSNVDVYARSKLCLAKYTFSLAERMKNTGVRVLMNHPGIAITPLGINAYGNWVSRMSFLVRPIMNSPEKSSLSFAYIVSHNASDGSLVGPRAMFNCYGYPKENRLPRKVKSGAEELIRFTEKELEKAKTLYNK